MKPVDCKTASTFFIGVTALPKRVRMALARPIAKVRNLLVFKTQILPVVALSKRVRMALVRPRFDLIGHRFSGPG